MAAADSLDLQHILHGHLEGEDMVVALLGGKGLAVDVQGNFLLGGIHLDGGHLVSALGVALGADVHELLLAPPGLVEIEGILLGFAVEGHQALVVHAGLATLVAGVRREVKHVPHMIGPHIGVTLEALEHELMVLGLVFLGVVVAAGMGGMQVRHALSAVLGVSQGRLGVAQVEEADPQIVQEQARHIPTQVQVPADVGHRIEGAAHGVAGQGGKAAGISLMDQVIQDVVVVQHVLLLLGGDGDLVGHAPADDAGVVVVLLNELLHLG